ncbi:uncharacterized protein EAF02_009622 [Botrytis sinoallii]|uniref:uncharacterized protein n=1 Tax=Botrytis sinoallii TaxID=1463999 RepID=UPI0018FF729D|nr:uncharacterized protein EAF02_009622 [Botrytis sinoallii]KAF7868886.1 hypothetical protein EAF02_009622 [Botrytis sinoallii]
MSDQNILELQRFKESQDRLRSRQSSRKRQYGLLKKAEQFRKVANLDVAMILFDPISQQYCTYRSRDDESWPPSIMEIVSTQSIRSETIQLIDESQTRLSNSVNYLPEDFELKERNATAVDENIHTGKKRRNKIPDISLKRKKANSKISDTEYRPKSSLQHHEEIEPSHESSPLAPESLVGGFNGLINEDATAALIMSGEDLEYSGGNDPSIHTNIQQPRDIPPLILGPCSEDLNDPTHDLSSSMLIPEDKLDYSKRASPDPITKTSLFQSSVDSISSTMHYTTHEKPEDLSSISTEPIPMPRLPGFLRDRFFNETTSSTQSPTYELPDFEDAFENSVLGKIF